MHSTLSYPRYSLACFSNGPENSAGINAVSSIRTPKYRRRKNSKDYTYERLTSTGRSSPKTSSPGRYGAIVALVRIRSGKILTQASVFTAWHRLDRASPLIWPYRELHKTLFARNWMVKYSVPFKRKCRQDRNLSLLWIWNRSYLRLDGAQSADCMARREGRRYPDRSKIFLLIDCSLHLECRAAVCRLRFQYDTHSYLTASNFTLTQERSQNYLRHQYLKIMSVFASVDGSSAWYQCHYALYLRVCYTRV